MQTNISGRWRQMKLLTLCVFSLFLAFTGLKQSLEWGLFVCPTDIIEKKHWRVRQWQKNQRWKGLEPIRMLRGTIWCAHEQHGTTFLHLFFSTCFWKTTLIWAKNTVMDKARYPLLLTNVYSSTTFSLMHVLSWDDHMAHTDVVEDKVGVCWNDPSMAAVR